MKKVILVHFGALMIRCYDILVKQDLYEEYKWVTEETYQAPECSYLQRWLKDNPGYVYLGSEDLGHIPEFNEGTRALINKLVEDGFQIVDAMKALKDEHVRREA